MKNPLWLAFVCLCFSGCVIIGNLDEIFTLKGYSDDKDAQYSLVKSIDDHYDALSKVLATGHIHDYKDEASFVQAFGDPLLKKDLPYGNQRWLYRHAIYRLSKDKVYLYFDHNQQLVKWEQLPCSKFF